MKKIFISYSHEDLEYKDLLLKQLTVLKLEGYCDLWEDSRIEIGKDWEQDIQKAIEQADIAILMVSAGFLTSEFIRSKEVLPVLKRREMEGLKVLPLFVKPCPWKQVKWLSGIEGFPSGKKAVSEYVLQRRLRLLTEFAESIHKILFPGEEKKGDSKNELRWRPPKEENDKSISHTDKTSITRQQESNGVGKKKAPPPKRNRAFYNMVIIILIMIGVYFGYKFLKSGPIIPDANKVEEDIKVLISRGFLVSVNKQGYTEVDIGDGMVLVYIPAGEFTMGSNEGLDREKPPHRVYLDGYWMGKTEVTVKQFQAFIDFTHNKTTAEKENSRYYWNNPGFSQNENHSVGSLSWNDAMEYCTWLSKIKGLRFTLPTEAQWEKGSRGTDGRKYPWGDNEPYYNGKWYANYRAKNEWEKKGEDGFSYSSPVGSYPQGASHYGLLDMAGNVWEWCSDWYLKDYYKESPGFNPVGPSTGDWRVIRGGAWSKNDYTIRCSNRDLGRSNDWQSSFGFRVVWSR